MSRVDYLPASCQVVHGYFCFKTLTVFTYIEFHRRMVEAIASRKPFDLLEVWPWLEDELDPERELADLVLDCEWTGKGRLRVEILPGLLELLPGADPENIYIGVHGKVKGPGEPIYWADIDFIHVMYFVEGKGLPVIEDDRLKILVPGESGSRGLPEGYSAHGSITPKPKPDYVPGRKKGHLTVVKGVPEPGHKKAKKRVERPDVVKYFAKVNPGSDWPVTFNGMCRDSKYRDLAKDSRTAHKRTKWGRIYSKGIDRLVDITGQSKRTVGRHIALMIKQKIIKEQWHGFKGQGYSWLDTSRVYSRGSTVGPGVREYIALR